MKVFKLEQVGAIKLLFYLEKRGETNMREMIKENKGRVGQHAIYSAVSVLIELGLVREERLTKPPRRVISLTERGKQMVKMLRSMNEILGK